LPTLRSAIDLSSVSTHFLTDPILVKSIRSIFYSALLAGVTLCLTGCLPEERFWWAPDGSQAAVVTEDQLRLVDATGALLAKMEVPEEWRVVRVEWLPDSRGFLLQSVQEVESWGQVTALVPRDEANQVLALSAEVPALLRVAEILDGDVGKSEDPFVRLGVGEADLFRNALTLGMKKDPETVIPALEKVSRGRGPLSDRRKEIEHFAIHRVDRVSLEELALPEQPLLASLRLLGPCRLSPSGEKLLFGRRHGRGTTVELVIHDLGDGAENLVTKRAFSTYEWESESSLVTLVPVGQGETLVKQVHRYHLAEGSKAKGEPLATALVPFLPHLEILADGTVLFSSQGSSLPTASSAVAPRSSLYRWSPESSALVRVPTEAGALPMNLGHFVASPDGTRVAVVESDTDAVAVVEVATGRVELVSPSHPYRKCRTLPAWRSAEELSFARFDSESGRVEWVLWNVLTGSSRVLNRDWSNKDTSTWIEEQSEKDE